MPGGRGCASGCEDHKPQLPCLRLVCQSDASGKLRGGSCALHRHPRRLCLWKNGCYNSGASVRRQIFCRVSLIYSGKTYNQDYRYPEFPSSVVTIPVDKEAVIKRGLVAPQDSAEIVNEIVIDLAGAPAITRKGYVGLGELLMLDIIATNAAEGYLSDILVLHSRRRVLSRHERLLAVNRHDAPVGAHTPVGNSGESRQSI